MNGRHLITVEEAFVIEGRSAVAPVPGFPSDVFVRVGQPLELRRPDGTVGRSSLRGVGTGGIERCLVLLDGTKADFPPGTEVWTLGDPTAEAVAKRP